MCFPAFAWVTLPHASEQRHSHRLSRSTLCLNDPLSMLHGICARVFHSRCPSATRHFALASFIADAPRITFLFTLYSFSLDCKLVEDNTTYFLYDRCWALSLTQIRCTEKKCWTDERSDNLYRSFLFWYSMIEWTSGIPVKEKKS